MPSQAVVRKRASAIPVIAPYLERLEAADTEETIFQGLYTIAEVVDVHRAKIGLHSDYIILIMSNQINPWGVLEFQRDFANPPSYVIQAAERLWKLCEDNQVDVAALLKKRADPLLMALNAYYQVADLPGTQPISVPTIGPIQAPIAESASGTPSQSDANIDTGATSS